MIKSFTEALWSNNRSEKIPEVRNYFGALIGEWDIDWNDHLYDIVPRRVKGEWIFSWVLEGAAVQDLFIVPSRAERLKNPQADAEYGTTLRIYNPETTTWDIFYGSTGRAFRLTAVKLNNEIVLTENYEGKIRHIFSEITANTFYWRKEYLISEGRWEIMAKVTAVRKNVNYGIGYYW